MHVKLSKCKERRYQIVTLKQSEIPVMQIWAGQLDLTSDDVNGLSEILSNIFSDILMERPFATWLTIGSWSSDLMLAGPEQNTS